MFGTKHSKINRSYYTLKQKLVHDTQSAQKAQSKERNTYIVKS